MQQFKHDKERREFSQTLERRRARLACKYPGRVAALRSSAGPPATESEHLAELQRSGLKGARSAPEATASMHQGLGSPAARPSVDS